MAARTSERPGRACAVAAGLLLILAAAPAWAGPALQDGVAADAPAVPWRGTVVGLQSAASALSLDPASELTYNPFVALGLNLEARWWLGRVLHLRLDWDVERELTDSDTTTARGDAVPGDVYVRLGASRFLRVPGVGLDLSADLRLQLPTSPAARARTLQLGAAPSLRVARSFPAAANLTLGYGYRLGWYGYEYTTAELETPLVTSCGAAARGCEGFLSSGVRNPAWRQQHSVDLSVQPARWLTVAALTTLYTDHLHPAAQDDRVSHAVAEPAEQRYSALYQVEAELLPHPGVGLALGALTLGPQLAEDATRRQPFFNRYTTLYLELRLHAAGWFAGRDA